MEKKLVVGLTVVSLLCILYSGLSLMAFSIEVIFSKPGARISALGVFTLVEGIIYLVLGIGVARLLTWARKSLVMVASLHAFLFIGLGVHHVWRFGMSHVDTAQALTMYGILFLFSCWSAYYLTRPKVKEQFR